MNKRERVLATIEKKDIDRFPTMFSKHFESDFAYGRSGIENHLKFFKESSVDIFKIMNEQLMPYIGDVSSPKDWLKIKKVQKDDDFIQLQNDFIKKIVSAVHKEVGENAYIITTVHGLVASGIHVVNRKFGAPDARSVIASHYREDRQSITDTYKYMADLLMEEIKELPSYGVDGIYFASLGGEKDYFSDEEFSELVAPLEIEILKYAKSIGLQVFLHICKSNINIRRYENYASFSDVINWGVYENNISLSAGKSIFPNNILMGGFSNKDEALIKGDYTGIKAQTKNIMDEIDVKSGFMVGADCTLPTYTDNLSIAMVTSALEELS